MLFETFCRQTYLGESGVSAPKSKTVTKTRAESIVNVLRGESGDPRFVHWIKKRGFQLVSHPVLGLHDVLCLPAKHKVCWI